MQPLPYEPPTPERGAAAAPPGPQPLGAPTLTRSRRVVPGTGLPQPQGDPPNKLD